MIRKRHHTRNKMYRRFLKQNTESGLIDMLENSLRKSSYFNFYRYGSECMTLNEFYTLLDNQLNKIDFCNDIDSIATDVICD